jgi:tartrate/fumarate subfamily iron-sulfur-dependent hydro-lyase beta chain
MVNFIRESKKIPIDLNEIAIYHCGPIVKKMNDEWTAISAGPTTSMRMEQFEDKIIQSLNVRLVIGKGGMGSKTEKAMQEFGAVYGAFPGGAAVLAASFIKKIEKVVWIDLGMVEAMWFFNVENFGPIIISIDSHGGNLYKEIRNRAEKILLK